MSMAAQLAIPAEAEGVTANERFKSRFRSWFWSGIILATLAHFTAFAYMPELTTEDFSFTTEELRSIVLPPEIEIPPPPQSIARPATPVIATLDVSEEITIAPTTFESNPIEELPPPPTLLEETPDLSAAPTFTPFTVAPDILNRRELAEAMVQNYPTLLREAGIGGVVRVFFFIDEDGRVLQTRLDQSSGHQQLDDAALAVAGMYRFSPALNRDERVKVWVSFPIQFQVH
jgi:protein TonB